MSDPCTEPISMYVPARNAAGTLTACLEAIRAQTRPPDELFIVVDPRSTDTTCEVAQGSGVNVVEQQGPTLGSARNEAIRLASHRWLASCDSDVVLGPDWLARLAERRDSAAAGIGGRTVEHVRGPCDAWRALQMPHHWGTYPLRNPFMLVSEVLFDRDALRAVGGYRDDFNYYEDSDLCQRLRDVGYDLFYEPAAVATHQRTDGLLGLLTLRWKYAEHRQKHLMDRFGALRHKIEVNRAYALNTLSKLLARGQEELAYISFLLYFHHLLLDLRSLLSRRPLISRPLRFSYERQLLTKVTNQLAEYRADLAERVSNDLDRLTPARSEPSRPDTPPGWYGHLRAVAAAVNVFCAEFSDPIWNIIEASARYVGGQASADVVPGKPTPDPQDLQKDLDGLAIEGIVDESFTAAIRQQWPNVGPIHWIGRTTDRERARTADLPEVSGHPVTLAPHLETRADPAALFSEIESDVNRLVVCYQPPSRFIPGLDVMSASDLASGAAAAGWTIERFDTLVGRTCLMLTRPELALAPPS